MKERRSLDNFTTMSGLHFQIFLMTLLYALFVTILSFLICYPVAYAAAMSESPRKLTLILLGLVIPYAINELLRIFSWVMILEKNGILNSAFRHHRPDRHVRGRGLSGSSPRTAPCSR